MDFVFIVFFWNLEICMKICVPTEYYGRASTFPKWCRNVNIKLIFEMTMKSCQNINAFLISFLALCCDLMSCKFIMLHPEYILTNSLCICLFSSKHNLWKLSEGIWYSKFLMNSPHLSLKLIIINKFNFSNWSTDHIFSWWYIEVIKTEKRGK